jgi:hypothetical protein
MDRLVHRRGQADGDAQWREHCVIDGVDSGVAVMTTLVMRVGLAIYRAEVEAAALERAGKSRGPAAMHSEDRDDIDRLTVNAARLRPFTHAKCSRA